METKMATLERKFSASFSKFKAKLGDLKRQPSFSDAEELKDHAPTTKEEEDKLVAMLRSVLGPQTGLAAVFCDDACLHRYLRARNWNVKKAEKMLRETLRWREEYKPESLRWEDVEKEATTGKMYCTPTLDKYSNPVLVMRPAKQNTSDHEGQIKFVVYTMERMIQALPPGSERTTWLIDFSGWSMKVNPPLKTSRETLSIMQGHYPERLSVAIMNEPPQLFQPVWNMLQPFMDAKTFSKVRFLYRSKEASLKIIDEYFDRRTLETTFGGTSEWTYDHAAYAQKMRELDAAWPKLLEEKLAAVQSAAQAAEARGAEEAGPPATPPPASGAGTPVPVSLEPAAEGVAAAVEGASEVASGESAPPAVVVAPASS